MTGWIDYALARGPELALRTIEHLMLTGLSTAAAVAVGIPIGVVAFHRPQMKSGLLSLVGTLQTIPSLAMLALLLVLFGSIGAGPALVALTLYALLPVVRNTVVGLEGVDASVGEAARGLGMTPWQELRQVRMPLALPVLAAGVRTAAVIGVGIATLSAFIGAGGLGQFINRGLALSDTGLILLGAIPSALLALMVDGSIAGLEWATDQRRHRAQRHAGRNALRAAAFALPLALLLAPGVALVGRERLSVGSGGSVAICTKNFTEQILLGELIAQIVEARTDLSVDRRFGLGGTIVCHNALVAGEVDVYPEYTGTALTAILGRSIEPGAASPGSVFDTVQARYEARFDVRWLPPFGFDNTYVLLASAGTADSLGLGTISDVAPYARDLSLGVTAEFAERPDGYPGFARHYGYAFAETRDLEPGLLYQAVAEGAVDLAFGFATDGRIDAYGLRVLDDDAGFFPPYEAAPVVRIEALAAEPALGAALELMADMLPDSTMRRLNLQAESGARSVAEIAADFLASRDLVEGGREGGG